jgi:hypothetical protein
MRAARMAFHSGDRQTRLPANVISTQASMTCQSSSSHSSAATAAAQSAIVSSGAAPVRVVPASRIEDLFRACVEVLRDIMRTSHVQLAPLRRSLYCAQHLSPPRAAAGQTRELSYPWLIRRVALLRGVRVRSFHALRPPTSTRYGAFCLQTLVAL